MPLLRRAISLALSAVMALGHPAEVLAASYVFRQPTTAGTYPVPVISNNVVTSQTYYKVDGRSYSISWQGTGGRSPYLIEMVGGPLPPGCSVPSQTGSILTSNCTFTTEGSYSGVIAQLTDANGMVVRDNAPTIYVSSPAPTLGTYNFPFNGYVGIQYSGSLRISGGRQPFNASRSTGDLPPGLSLSTAQDVNSGVWSVVLSGAPTTTGSFTFDILVTDANQKQATSSKINISVGYGPVSLTLRPSPVAGVFNAVAGKPLPGAGVSIVGGQPPVSLTQSAGLLPPGLTLGADGQLEGAPTKTGTYSGIQIRAVDGASTPRTATSAAFSVVVAAGLSAVVQGASDAYQRNSPIATVSTAVSGGTSPYSYALNGTLPPGLSFATATGRITGTPTVAGRYSGLSVVATDANGYTAETSPFAMVVADPLTISGTPPRGVAGSSYSFAFAAAGGTSPYAFKLVQGDLPFGLDLSGTGTISGTPYVSGTTDGLIVRVTDANGTTRDTAPFSISIADQLAVASIPARAATSGVAYSSAFTAAGGTAPYSFALVAGSLPPGLSLASSGAVSGTPTSLGVYGPFSVRLVDAEGRIATADATIEVSSPLSISGSPQAGTVGSEYAASYAAAGGTGPYAFDVLSGVLPPGLSLDAAGRISGTPTQAGSYGGIVVRVTDAAGRTAQTTSSIVVGAPLRIAGTPSASGTVGQSYSASFGASGGTGPYTFTLASGTLPAGLALSSTSGSISGAPSATGRSEGLTVKVSDAAGRTAVSDAFRIVVTDVLAVAGSASTQAVAGQAYAAQFSASGGSTPYAWTLASGTLPPGIALDASTGLVSGTPTTLGSYPNLQVRATDGDGRTALSAIFGISVSSSLAIAGTPSSFATVGQPYSAQFTATGGAGTKIFSLATGQMPAGLTFDAATGLISGTPTAKGFTPTIAVRVRDETNSAATAPAFDLYVSDPLAVSGAPSSDAIVGADYSGNATVAGGRPAYAWTLDAGTLPPGLQLSAVTGVVSGTPTQAGTASGLRLRVVDVDGRAGTTGLFSITVAAPLAVGGRVGPGTVGTTYSAQFTASGGTSPYAFQIAGAALPAGLTLDAATGLISGTPTVAAPGGTMQMRVADAKGRTVSTASFSIDVRDPFRLVPSNIGPGTVGQSYSAGMTPAGGRGPFALSVAAGSLPPGLTLEPGTGVIAGTPSQAGTYPDIVIAGVDADGRTARSEPFGIDVAVGMAVAGVPPQPATVGVPYSFAFTASGGQPAYAWTLADGNLPAGLVLDGVSGSIGGTPTRAESVSNLTAVATDRARRTASSKSFAIDVRDPVAVAGDPARVAVVGQSYSAPFTASGGRGPYTFSMVGVLPAGLTLSPTSGTISGAASVVSDVSGLRVRATDADGRVGTSGEFAISTTAVLTLAGSPAAAGDVGTAYSAKFTASGGKAPYAFAVAAGTLPGGLVLDGTSGTISGTPTATATATGLQVAVSDANGTRVASQTFSIAISDPLSAVAEAARGTVGSTYAARIAAAGGRAPYTYALAAGTLPAGLSLDPSSGRIAGTPSAAANNGDLQVRVADADGRTALTPAFRIVVDGPLVLASVPAQTATVGIAYDSTISAAGGRAPYAYALASGTLPAGIALDPTSGRLSGTPTTIGAAEGLSIAVSDADGRAATSKTFRIDVRDAMAVAGAASAYATTGQTYGPFQFTATGGRGPYAYEMVGTLPAGLTLSASGVLSGAPTRTGTVVALQVRATDLDGRTALSPAFDIQASAGLLVSAVLPGFGTTGTAYSGSASTSGGRAPYAYDLAAGALPPGVAIDAATGLITGTPTATGTYAGISIRVADADGRKAAASAASIVVSDPLSATARPDPAVRSAAYVAQVSVLGGRASYAYSLAAGTLPTGLTLDAARGTISGTPTVVQIATGLQVRVVDADGRSALTSTFSISVAPALSLSLVSPLTATLGTSFTAAATAAGGRAPYAYDLAAGSLPAGLTLDAANGTIAGTPSATGRVAVTVRVADADGRTATAGTTISVAGAMAVAATNSDAVATVGQPFSRGLAVVGGQSPYGFVLASGTLPSGLTLDARTGTIAGTPTREGTFGNLSILVTDAEGRTANTGTFIIDVRGPPVFSGVPSSVATVGLAYDSAALVSGGSLPYVYSLAAGTLPAGLTLSSTSGRIAGTPTTVGTLSGLQIQAVDQDGRVALSAPFPIDVRAAVVVAGSPSTTATTSTTYGPTAFVASGGRSPYAYAVIGSLPPGLSLSSTGSLSGTPTTAGPFPGLQVRATDADGRTGLSDAFAITVSQPLAIAGAPATAATVGTAYAAGYSARNGRQPYAYALAAGTLPTGLTLDAASGQISGTPSATGTFSGIQVRATDADGRIATAPAFALAVSNPLTASASPGPAIRSTAYSLQIAVQGGRSGYSYALAAGTLPAGLTLGAATGTISGTPTTTQVASGLQVRATDADGRIATTDAFAISVAPALSLALANPIQGTLGAVLSTSANPSGGRSPYAISVSSGSLPPGISLDAGSGAISGTPTATGTYAFSVAATDVDGRRATASTSLVVQGPLSVAGPTNVDGIVGSTFASSTPASGGSGSYTFALVAGTLPPGLSMNASTGAIGGTPTTAGTYQGLQVRATDGTGRQGFSPSFDLTVDATMSVGGSLTNGSVGTSYFASIAAQGGRSPYAYGLAAGSLPPGLVLNGSTGGINGTPSTGGTFTGIQILATDALGRSAATGSLSMQVAAPLAVVGTPTAYAVRGTTYSSGVSGTGGRAPYTFSVSSGTLPSGLTISSTSGAITGRPTNASSTFTVRLQDADGRTAFSPSFSITVSDPLTLAVADERRTVVQGDDYSATLAAAGGAAPYTFAPVNGYLPDGLALTVSGANAVLAGNPTAATTWNLPIRVTDASGATATVVLSMNVVQSYAAGSGIFTFVSEYDWVDQWGRFYRMRNPVTGGQAPVAFSAPDGLPTGLSIDPNTGEISGTANAPRNTSDNATYRIVARDAVGRTASTNLTQYASGTALFATIAGASRYATLDRPYSHFYARANSGSGPYTIQWQNLPPGLSAVMINGNYSKISGTPTQTGSWAVTCTATDRLGNSVTCQSPQTIQIVDDYPTANEVGPTAVGSQVNNVSALYMSFVTGGISKWDLWGINRPVIKAAGSSMDITYPEPVRANALYQYVNSNPGSSAASATTFFVSTDKGQSANAKYSGGMWVFDRTIYGSKFHISMNQASTSEIAAGFVPAFGDYPTINNNVLSFGLMQTNAYAMKDGVTVDVTPTINIPWYRNDTGNGPRNFRYALRDDYPLPPGLTFNPASGRVTGTIKTAGATKGLYWIWVYGTDDTGRVWDNQSSVMQMQIN